MEYTAGDESDADEIIDSDVEDDFVLSDDEDEEIEEIEDIEVAISCLFLLF